jgi:hypothetical protein
MSAIAPFVNARLLTNPPPETFRIDVSADGAVNGLDIQTFTDALPGP